jgi:hypothetical protein
MASKTITRTDIRNEQALSQELIAISKANPDKYITYWATFGKVRIAIHDRKPQSTNAPGAEFCYREEGGFFKNGQIVKPSATFIKQFNFTPVLG